MWVTTSPPPIDGQECREQEDGSSNNQVSFHLSSDTNHYLYMYIVVKSTLRHTNIMDPIVGTGTSRSDGLGLGFSDGTKDKSPPTRKHLDLTQQTPQTTQGQMNQILGVVVKNVVKNRNIIGDRRNSRSVVSLENCFNVHLTRHFGFH